MMNLTTLDITTFQELFLRSLRENVDFRRQVQNIVLEPTPTREEFTQWLKEMKDLREESNRRWEESSRRFDEHGRRFDRMMAEIQILREQSDRRWEEHEARFDRLEQKMDNGFAEIHEILVQHEARFDRLEQKMDNGFAEIHGILVQHEARFDRLEQKMDNGFSEIHEILVPHEARFDSLEQKIDNGFANNQKMIDRLGQRWGIRNESVLRGTVATLMEKAFGVKVASRWIKGEQFDLIITNGQHILVEITASAGANIQKSLERKRDIYTEATGRAPDRIILAVGSIYSKRAQALEEAGFEVIEPEEEED